MPCADHYRPLAGEAGQRADFNPGNCWVTRVAFEPKVAVAAMMALLQPHMDAGRLTLHLRTQGCCRRGRGRSHRLGNGRRSRAWRCRCAFARLWFSTRPSSAICCRSSAPNTAVGAETIAETGEAHAQPTEPKPHCVQSFTYVFGLERRPQGERHVDRATGTLRVLSRLATLQPAHRGARRRDLRRGERLAQLQGASRPCPAPRAGCGPIAG